MSTFLEQQMEILCTLTVWSLSHSFDPKLKWSIQVNNGEIEKTSKQKLCDSQPSVTAYLILCI